MLTKFLLSLVGLENCHPNTTQVICLASKLTEKNLQPCDCCMSIGYLPARNGANHVHYYLQLSEGNPQVGDNREGFDV